jgi:hypothetical protein
VKLDEILEEYQRITQDLVHLQVDANSSNRERINQLVKDKQSHLSIQALLLHIIKTSFIANPLLFPALYHDLDCKLSDSVTTLELWILYTLSGVYLSNLSLYLSNLNMDVIYTTRNSIKV